MHRNRLKKSVGPVISGPKQVPIRPDLGIKRASPCVEHSHNFPFQTPEADGIADRESFVGDVRILTDDDFGKAGLEHPAFHDFDFVANVQNIPGNASKLHVGVCARRFQRNRSHHHNLSGHQRPVRASRDSRRVLNNFHCIDAHASGHFRCRPGAHDYGVVFGAGRNQRRLESASERQHRHEDAHGTGNSENCNDGRSPACFDASQIVNDRNGHFRPSSTRQPRASAWRRDPAAIRWQLRPAERIPVQSTT